MYMTIICTGRNQMVPISLRNNIFTKLKTQRIWLLLITFLSNGCEELAHLWVHAKEFNRGSY